MSVYVDAAIYPYGRMMMCHMLADTPAELRAMAEIIRVQLKWFQDRASAPHFDICKSKRALAVAAGAIEIERDQRRDILLRIKDTWPRTPRGNWKLADDLPAVP